MLSCFTDLRYLIWNRGLGVGEQNVDFDFEMFSFTNVNVLIYEQPHD